MGSTRFLSFEGRVNTVAEICVAEICKRGHADKLVRSHDAACYNHWLPDRALPAVLPRWHYLQIHNYAIPALKKRGVTGEQLRMMVVGDLRRIFEQQNSY